MEFFKIAGSILAILICVPFVWLMWSLDEKPRKPSPAEQQLAGARYACQEFISDRLHDPSSAEWGMSSGHWWQTWPAQPKGKAVTVSATFRANNALGIKVLSSWTCKVKETDQSWQLISLSET
ncbi:hypothetical protein DL1_11960 [Thioclava dalianensis]|uniref:Uncharacterized protein n=1 Tax=Thioclava dalianensis TaxID=1185766 RepID=A0A074U194_9RHOB|nr:hypothetical protein [Thioclava dalianensis]KEP68437.1 hypothetical protein DL1_11960 [Thioclava dalianensis]SFN62734.1 hypothetical protein SAMN05216224_10855 [Thioclava dalianensis]